MRTFKTWLRHFFLGHSRQEVAEYKATHPWLEWGDHIPGIFERSPEEMLWPGFLSGIFWSVVILIALLLGLIDEARAYFGRLRGMFKTRWVDIA